jgi:hypothetical protein
VRQQAPSSRARGGALGSAATAVLVDRDVRDRLPGRPETAARAGQDGLPGHGPDSHHPVRPAAAQVDQVLRGADPASRPIGTPERDDVAITVNTAAAPGTTVPPEPAARATGVSG